MNWQELKSYVNEEGRTRVQHERVARTIGVNPDAKGNLLLYNINRRIESRIKSEGPGAISGFTPPNNRTTNHSPQRQRDSRSQTPPPVPPAQTPPPTGLGDNFLTNGGIWQLLVAVAAVAVIVVLAFWAYDNLTDDDESGIPTSPEATPTAGPSNSPPATATSPAGGGAGTSNGGQPTTAPPTGQTGRLVSNATITSVSSQFDHGNWSVTLYEGSTDRIENWFRQLPDLNPVDCPKFPNVDNACISGFQASYGMQYGKEIDIFCQTVDSRCMFVNSASHIRYYSGDYDFGFDACSQATNPNGEGCLHININVSETTETMLEVIAHQGWTLTGVFFDSDHMEKTLYGVGSHAVARMLNIADSDSDVNDGSNCSNINGCPGVRVAISVTSGNELVVLGTTVVTRP